tara:strand:- start:3889 stop:4887 length:999 start_codon:yes stop_codon:yes gene_type:complete
MKDPILKTGWERTEQHLELTLAEAQTLITHHTSEALQSVTLLTNGCGNTNYKATLKNGHSLVIRIYQRQPSALTKEVGIHQLVHTVLPVPEIYYADPSCTHYPHPYTLTECIDGALMRDFLFTSDEASMTAVMREAGEYLNILRSMKLPIGGFFDEQMQIKPFEPEDEYFNYITQLLQHENVKKNLGRNLHQSVLDLVSQCSHLFPQINDANLTHADFDPGNILVNQVSGNWQVAGILDWEFSHAGSYLLDIGSMLRYSHKLPAYFETSFISGIEESGLALPSDWKKQSQMLNLLCLTQLLQANSTGDRPYMCRDIVRLIQRIVQTLPDHHK